MAEEPYENNSEHSEKTVEHHVHATKLRKKLNLYFLLISIVAISVSGEIILEMSSGELQEDIIESIAAEFSATFSPELYAQIKAAKSDFNMDKIFDPIYSLRNRMILILLVVTLCIVGAFFMFSKDIVTPMGGLVSAAKKLAAGDLTVKVPIISQDEIGQVGELINEINEKLIDMINQVKEDLERYKEKVDGLSSLINGILTYEKNDVLETRKIKFSDFRAIMDNTAKCSATLEVMKRDLEALEVFVSMYKTYRMGDVSEDELNEAFNEYTLKE